MCALRRLPRVVLAGAECILLLRMPADRGRVDEDLRAFERSQSGGLRIPLVPAHENAERADRRIERAESEIAWREVELLVVTRIVGNVHLAVLADGAARAVHDYRRVVIETRRPRLEQRQHERYVELLRECLEFLRRRSRYPFSEVEETRVLALTEVTRTK